MAIYRQIHVSFWQDTFVLDLTPEEKYFYLYLMTNSKTSQCGVYELPVKVMELETGYNRETVEKLLNRFIDYGKIRYSHDTKEILLINWYKYNCSLSPKVESCIIKEMAEIKEKLFYQYCTDTVLIQYRKSRGKNKNNNNNNKNNNKKEECASGFDLFWPAYPKKKSKGDAEKAWKTINPDTELFDKIMAGVEQAKKSTDWTKESGKYIPYPATWLRSKGWEDEYKESQPSKGKIDYGPHAVFYD